MSRLFSKIVNGFFIVVGLVAMVALPIGFLANLGYDLAHPERLSDCQHDPRLYGTLALVVGLPLAWIMKRKFDELKRSMLALAAAKARRKAAE